MRRIQVIILFAIFATSVGCSIAKAPPFFTDSEKKVVVKLVSIFEARKRGYLYFKDPEKLCLRPEKDIDEAELEKLINSSPAKAASITIKLFQRSVAWWR